jgi:hypothetical protein
MASDDEQDEVSEVQEKGKGSKDGKGKAKGKKKGKKKGIKLPKGFVSNAKGEIVSAKEFALQSA